MRKVFLSSFVRSQEAFTLIEVAVSMAILVILFSIGVFFGPSFYRGQVLLAERDNVVSILMRARSKAASNIHGVNHGVYVDADSYVIFEGANYAARNVAYDERYPRAAGAEVSGASQIVFLSLEASANPTGTIIIGGQSISVGNDGEINW